MYPVRDALSRLWKSAAANLVGFKFSAELQPSEREDKESVQSTHALQLWEFCPRLDHCEHNLYEPSGSPSGLDLPSVTKATVESTLRYTETSVVVPLYERVKCSLLNNLTQIRIGINSSVGVALRGVSNCARVLVWKGELPPY